MKPEGRLLGESGAYSSASSTDQPQQPKNASSDELVMDAVATAESLMEEHHPPDGYPDHGENSISEE